MVEAAQRPQEGAPVRNRAWRSRGARFFMVLILTAIMAVPLLMLGLIADERARYSAETIREIGAIWGGEQTLSGPFLHIPARSEQRIVGEDGAERLVTRTRLLTLTPRTLDIAVEAETQTRQRGIYEAVVYTAQARFEGAFAAPDLTRLLDPGETPLWEEATLSVHVSDPRAFSDAVSLTWDGAEIPFEPGAAGAGGAAPRIAPVQPYEPRAPVPRLDSYGNGVHARIGDPRAAAGDFGFTLNVRGSGRLETAPLARTTTMRMETDWPHPSFIGDFLPEARSIDADGFSAEWRVPHLARGSAGAWVEGEGQSAAQAARLGAFGVSFYQPVNFYQKVERALKYAVMFIGLTFLAVFLIETSRNLRTHAVQYLLVGLAQCVFFLLLLALAEHIGFALAYLSAAGATIALLTLYVATGLKAGKATWAALAVLVTLYGFLYLLLESRDYALLIGAVAAFLTVGATMVATRNIDWRADVD